MFDGTDVVVDFFVIVFFVFDRDQEFCRVRMRTVSEKNSNACFEREQFAELDHF